MPIERVMTARPYTSDDDRRVGVDHYADRLGEFNAAPAHHKDGARRCVPRHEGTAAPVKRVSHAIEK
jgi:hypothetical protein